MPRRRGGYSEVDHKLLQCACHFFWAIPCFSLLSLIGFLMPIRMPTFYFNEFYAHALHISQDNPNSNITRTSQAIFFDLKLQNSMDHRGVRYDPLNLTFFYVPNTTGTPLYVANYTIPGFYQGYGSAAKRRDVVVAPGLPWEEALRAVSGGSTAVFKVDVVASMKFKYMASYSRRKIVKVGANVEVDSSGRKVQKDPVKFNSTV